MTPTLQILVYVLIALVAIAIGVAGTILIQNRVARSRARQIIDDANRNGEVIRQQQLLKSKEEGLKITQEAERNANQRLQKVQAVEAKMKKREMELNQFQQDNQRNRQELETRRQKLDAEEEARRLKDAEKQEENDERRDSFYGSSGKKGTMRRRPKFFLFGLDDLDNEEIISLVEMTPTYKRSKETLSDIKSKAFNSMAIEPEITTSTAAGSVISF